MYCTFHESQLSALLLRFFLPAGEAVGSCFLFLLPVAVLLLPTQGSIPCSFFKCVFKLTLCVNAFSQCSHWKGFSFVCCLMCAVRLQFWVNPRPHMLQMKPFTLLWLSSCLLRPPFVLNVLPHILQVCRVTWCMYLMCLKSDVLSFPQYSHISLLLTSFPRQFIVCAVNAVSVLNLLPHGQWKFLLWNLPLW